MRAEVCRDGYKYAQEYKQGKPTTAVKKINTCKERGTTIIFEPDPEIFKEIVFDRKKILNHLRQQAYLTKGISIDFYDLRDEKNPFDYHFYFEGGIKSYLKYLVKNDDVLHPNPFYGIGEKEDILVEAAFTYIDDYEIYEESFVNNIFTSEGGMHLTGLRAALTRVINDYARKQGFLKETEPNLTGDDIREGLTAIVSVKIKEPQFEGQTKSKLGNPEARTATETVVAEALTDYLEKFPQDAKIIVEKLFFLIRLEKQLKQLKKLF